jgi:hypothetical protein
VTDVTPANERGHFLFDYETDQKLGPATDEQVEASDRNDFDDFAGSFWIDADGRPTTQSDPDRPGVRRVYTWHD